MDDSQLNLQALIAEIATLNCEDPNPLEVVPVVSPDKLTFRLIGRLLSQRPSSAYWVRDILVHAWKFALPFEVVDLPAEKLLFTLYDEAHVDRILSQGPWNIKGSPLILKLWTPALSFEEVKLITCPF
jgi:hypothetical protein